ncbi:MAG: RNA 2',3'-cyclic phosphodiesterase, partial [Tissierellia bacterium]|nr:RNA 2',3'-cyclic phosphodiesterase [Tissierellia bacterium]
MRSFIAINFSKTEKTAIENIIKQVQKHSTQGRFVKNEHIHLTLEFLGEISQNEVKIIENIIDEIDFKPFTMDLSQLGYFKRRDGNIYWLGIEDNHTLFEIQGK